MSRVIHVSIYYVYVNTYRSVARSYSLWYAYPFRGECKLSGGTRQAIVLTDLYGYLPKNGCTKNCHFFKGCLKNAEDPWFRLHSRITVAAMVSGPANAVDTLIYTTVIIS